MKRMQAEAFQNINPTCQTPLQLLQEMYVKISGDPFNTVAYTVALVKLRDTL